jgi:hypothetical protein
MSSSPAAASAEISIPAERIIKELTRNAHAGFYGQTEVRLALTEDALQGVALVIVHKRTVRSSDQPSRVGAAEKDTERERSVQKVVGDVAKSLRLRLSAVKIVGHFADGMCNNCEVVDEQAATVI